MQVTSSTYRQLFDSGSIQEYRVVIDGIEYTEEHIKDTIELTQNLFDKSTFTVGSFTIGVMKLKLKVPSDVIPLNANVVFSYSYNNGEEQSEWIEKFKGKISKRNKYTDEITIIEVKDAASNYDVFLDYYGESLSEYPANARTVANLCATHLGLELDNINDIINMNIVEFPNDMTVVEVLKNIARNSGGNWVIVGNKLRLVIAKNVTEIEYTWNDFGSTRWIDTDKTWDYGQTREYPAQSIETNGLLSPISKVVMYYDDASAFESGDDGGSTLEIDSKWATVNSTDYVHGILNGYEYKPVTVSGAYVDPALDIGDVIEVDGNQVLMANVKWTFDGITTVDIEVPINNEKNYDDPYNNLVQQQFSKKVSLGDSYQGITISREKGFEALMSPDGSEENAIGRYYADLTRGIAFQTRNVPSDPWHDWMYFDTNDKTFKISLYDNAVERIDDTLVDFGLSLEGIEGKIEGVSFGSILINHNGEDDTYEYWTFFTSNPKLIPFIGLYGKLNMSPYTTFEPIEDSNTLSNSKISFFANGSAENGTFVVRNDYKYGFRIRRVSGNQPFSVEIREYDENESYLRKTTHTFNTVQSYHDISNIEFGNDTEYVGLRYIVSGVSWSNRLELAEGMFGIGAPKPYVENVDGVRAWAQSQFQIQQSQIDLKVATKDFTGDRMVSLISVQPANVKIASKNLDLEGVVKFTNLTDASTIISGDNVKTGKIKSQYLEFDNAVGTNVKLTGEINATKGTFSNVNISGNLNAGKVGNLIVTSTGITFPNGKLKLDSANNEIAFGTMKMKHRQAPSNVGARDVIEISTSSGKIEFLSGLTYPGGQLPNTLSADAVHTRNITGQDILAIGGMEGVPEVRISGIPLIIDAFRPRYNEENIGTASYRYRRIYLQNQPNVSSDNRIKSAIQDIPQDLVSRLMEIKPKMYLQGTQWHFGYIAQDVERALYLWATKRYGKEAKYYVDKFAMLHKSESHLSLLYGELAVLKEQQIMNEIIKLNNRLEILENERH